MLDEILNEVKREKLIEQGDVVLAGLSGGADSVCLLLILKQMKEYIPFELRAVHVEHGIRGEESRRDARFAEQLCERNGIACYIYKEDVPEFARKEGIGLEEAARKKRYECYKKAMSECEELFPGSRIKVALAHHAQDNAETVLFQMIRGSGLNGLCGMQYEREFGNGSIIRPLLAQGREQIEAYLKSQGETYCTDATNEDTDYSRNRIRHLVLPELCAINDQAVAHINQSAFFLQDMREFLCEEADRIQEMYVCEKENGIQLYPGVWEECHRMVSREIIHRVIGKMAGSKKDITSAHVEAVYRLFELQVGRKIELPYDLTAWRNYHGVLLKKKDDRTEETKKEAVEISREQLNELFSGKELEILLPDGIFCLRGREKTGEITEIDKKTYTKCFDYDKIKCGLQIRTRETGDYLAVDCDGHSKKLKEYFVNEKIPAEERDDIWLLAEGSHILWVAGHRISAAYKIDDNTKRILEVQFFGGRFYES